MGIPSMLINQLKVSFSFLKKKCSQRAALLRVYYYAASQFVCLIVRLFSLSVHSYTPPSFSISVFPSLQSFRVCSLSAEGRNAGGCEPCVLWSHSNLFIVFIYLCLLVFVLQV